MLSWSVHVYFYSFLQFPAKCNPHHIFWILDSYSVDSWMLPSQLGFTTMVPSGLVFQYKSTGKHNFSGCHTFVCLLPFAAQTFHGSHKYPKVSLIFLFTTAILLSSLWYYLLDAKSSCNLMGFDSTDWDIKLLYFKSQLKVN